MTLMMTLMTIMIIGNASRATCRVYSLLYFVEFCSLPVLSQTLTVINHVKSIGIGAIALHTFFIIRHNKDLC